MSHSHKQAAAEWPPDPKLPVEEQIAILVSVIDGMLALLPLGTIDTLRVASCRILDNQNRVDAIEEHLGLRPKMSESLIGDSEEKL